MMRGGASVPMLRGAFVIAIGGVLAACAGHGQKTASGSSAANTHAVRPGRRPWKPLGPYTPGGLYAPGVADGAPDVLPDVANLPEPVPHAEPLSRFGNRSPYTVLGKTYTVLASAKGYDERGIASWYGTKFDGRTTSNFEQYDLTQFSAAHRTLPLPSYARVTNLENGRSVIVRINDRGPFHDGRLIDLSYAAAVKLGVNIHGTARVEVQGIDPGEPSAKLPKPAIDVASAGAIVATPKPAALPPVVPATKSPTATDADAAATLADPAAASRVVVEALPPDPAPASASTRVTMAGAAMDSSRSPTTHAATIVAPSAVAVVGPPAIGATTRGFLQIASYSDRDNAERMLQRVVQAGVEHAELVSVLVAGHTLWRVHVGPLRADEAEAVADRLDRLGFGRPPFFKD